MSRIETKELNWFEEGINNLHSIVNGLAELKKQTNIQLNKKVPNLITLAEYYGMDTSDDKVYPLQFKLIQAKQQKEKQLLEKARTSAANYQ
eukprot:15325528-Ditylum_brightwellii.AAC.1